MQNLRCKLHPNENIANFCTRQQCQTQLCATCICDHTDNHALGGTIPHYENIIQTHKRAHEVVDMQRMQIQAHKKKIIQFNQKWQKKKQSVYEKIRVAKKDTLQLVQRTFAQLQHQYVQKVHEQQIKIGMKDADKVMKMLEAHRIQSDKLFSIQKQLTGVRGPETAKLIFTQAIPQSTQLLQKLQIDFSSLEVYQMNLDYHQSNIHQVRQKIHSLFSFVVKYPQNLVFTPLVQVIQNRSPSVANSTIVGAFRPFIQTNSSSGFYARPNSAGKAIKGQVTYVGHQTLLQNKPKISLVSGKLVQNNNEASRIVGKPLRRSTIFNQQSRILTQVVR